MEDTLTLKQQAQDLLDNLREGQRFSRKVLISVLSAAVPLLPDDAENPGVSIPSTKPVLETEATPVRFNPPKWGNFGTCKRCMSNSFTPGDTIVRIYGKGWWHDECYRIVNPKFYEGI